MGNFHWCSYCQQNKEGYRGVYAIGHRHKIEAGDSGRSPRCTFCRRATLHQILTLRGGRLIVRHCRYCLEVTIELLEKPDPPKRDRRVKRSARASKETLTDA